MTAAVVWCFHDAPDSLRALFDERGTKTWLAHFPAPAATHDEREAQVGGLALALNSDADEIEGWLTSVGLVCVARFPDEDLLTAGAAL